MIIVLSPAKSLDFATPLPVLEFTQPAFSSDAALLIERLRRLSTTKIAALMTVSERLAELNRQRYADWREAHDLANSRQALLAFNGDVYAGLDAATLKKADLKFAQRHLRILSGLYGVLRPFDLIAPYRLEMSTALANSRGKDLYAFWGDRPTQAINALLEEEAAKTLVNLASNEYFRALQPAKLAAPVVQPVFEDWSGGKYKVVSFFAKRARGLMARYAIVNRVKKASSLRAFDSAGYAFADSASDDSRWVFRRRVEQRAGAGGADDATVQRADAKAL